MKFYEIFRNIYEYFVKKVLKKSVFERIYIQKMKKV